MAATVEYFATKNRKLELRQGAVGERINKKIEMLHKALVALERAEGRVDDYLAEIQELQNEHEQLGDSVTEVDDA
jgi:prefoldin subunit 5